MIKINLLEVAESKATKRSGMPRFSLSSNAAAIAAVAIVVLAVLFVAWKTVSLKGRIDELEQSIAEADEQLRELEKARKTVDEYQAMKSPLEHRVELISELKRRQQVPVHLLDEISRELPEFLWLEKLVDRGSRIEIAGKATTYNAVSNFYNNLSDSPWFDQVELGNTQRVAEGVSFKLSCRFRPPAEITGGESESGAGDVDDSAALTRAAAPRG